MYPECLFECPDYPDCQCGDDRDIEEDENFVYDPDEMINWPGDDE